MQVSNLPPNFASAKWLIPDPGASGTLPRSKTGHVALVSAAAESRTLPNPVKEGLRLLLSMSVDGGDITVTADSAYDESGSTTIVFSDPGQFILLESVLVAAGTYAWRRLSHDGVTGPKTASLVVAGNAAFGANATDRATIKGMYMNPSAIAVAVPTIANDAAENVDSVAVDVSSAFSIQPAVGDAVIAIPLEALPTDCLLCGAYVTATDTITVTFGSKEGGGGVTGANKNFQFLVFDLT